MITAYTPLRAVCVPAGDHIVVWTFRPRPYVLGAMLSLLTIVLVVVALAASVAKWEYNLLAAGRVDHCNNLPAIRSARFRRVVPFRGCPVLSCPGFPRAEVVAHSRAVGGDQPRAVHRSY